jgi:hypothetical protein
MAVTNIDSIIYDVNVYSMKNDALSMIDNQEFQSAQCRDVI